MFGVNPINGSVQWLGVPAPLKTYGLPWTDNILASSSACVTGGNYTNPNWLSQPDEPYGIFSVLWSGPAHAMLSYVRRIPENTCSTTRRIHDNLLQENCTACMQSLSTSRSILLNCLVNR